MSRRKKNLRAFKHQHPANDMTIEKAWDAAWEGAQKHYHSRRMQELEAELAALKEAAQAEVDRQRHQCGILRQELQPTTAALASLLQEKGE